MTDKERFQEEALRLADISIKEQQEIIERYEKALKQCMEAMRKNLAYAQLKDEEILYVALKNAEQLFNN